MAVFLLRRLLFAILVLFAVSFFSFVLVFLAGDPARSLAGVDTNEEHLAMIRRSYGLDRPIHEQYALFLRNAIRGELGQSFRYNMDAGPLVAQKFAVTMQLALASLAISVVIALPLGILSAVYRRTFLDEAAGVVSLVGVSTPGFWLGILLILVFADWLRWLPPSGNQDGLRSLVLPALALSAYNIGLLTRLMRRSMVDELRQPYVTVAHAKGQRPLWVYLNHALRNALIPTVTVIGLQFGALLGGSLVIETVFAWPGLGYLMIQAIRTNDLPVVRAAVMVAGVAFVFINLCVDLIYGLLDPRIRYR